MFGVALLGRRRSQRVRERGLVRGPRLPRLPATDQLCGLGLVTGSLL